ncbi:hypothetical protein FACS189456_1510 [Bacteroidia bacterium]|nr:hypothetical protein FACS189456_1510 [Bacteroidia bacterium]
MNNRRLQQFFIGIALGVLIPVGAFYIFFRSNYDYMPFAQYVEMLSLQSLLSKVLAVAAIPNLLAFYLCLWMNKDNAARGILGGTMITAIIVAILYFVY